MQNIWYHMFSIVLQKSPEEVDQRSADMWSYAMILWELVTREVPFGHLSPMEVGMKVMGWYIIEIFISIETRIHAELYIKDVIV